MIFGNLAIAFLISVVSIDQPVSLDIKLDGVIEKNEWAGAEIHELTSGGQLYVLRKENVLYIGIKAISYGWGHVYLHRSDSVKVLHSSAALGSQLYVSKDGQWILQNKFNWELREKIYDESMRKRQEIYYRSNGWCANNNNTGEKGTLEFKINLDGSGKAKTTFAALFTDIKFVFSYYPQQLKDDTLLKELVYGNAPDSLNFQPATWVPVKK